MPTKLYDLKVPICFPNAVTKKVFIKQTVMFLLNYNKNITIKNQNLIMRNDYSLFANTFQ